MGLDESKGYRVVFFKGQDSSTRERIELALAPQTNAALRCYQAVSFRRVSTSQEYMCCVLVVVAYASTDQSSAKG